MPLLHIGTRKFGSIRHGHPPTGHLNGRITADKGLLSRVVPATATFIQPATIKGSLGDFSTGFSVGQPIAVRGTNLNNGERIVISITVGSAAELMVVDEGVKAEGPLAGVEIRTV